MKKTTKNQTMRMIMVIIFLCATRFAAFAVDWNTPQTLANGADITTPINLTGNVTVNVASGTATISGNITGSGTHSLTKTGTGILVFKGTNTYSGLTTIEAGQIRIGNNTNTGSITGNVNIKAGASILFYRSTDLPAYSGIISGEGDVGIEQAAGVITLSGDNTYTGATNVGGSLKLGGTSGKAIASSSNVTLFHATSKLDVSSSNHLIKQLNTSQADAEVILGAGTLLIGTTNPGNCGKYSGRITGTGNVAKEGTGKWTIAGAKKDYTGVTYVRGGTLQLGDGVSSGELNNTAGTGGIELNSSAAPAIIRFEPYADITFSKVISGTGSVEFKASGTKKLSLGANNTYSGETIIEEGVLTLLAAGHIASSSAVRLNSNYAQLAIEGNKTIKHLNTTFANAVVALGANTLTINTTDNTTFAGRITGAGGVTKTGPRSFYLTGENTYDGVTTIQEGGVFVGNGDGTSATGSIKGNIVINGSSSLCFGRNTNYEYKGNISGTGENGVHHIGSANLTLSGTLTYTGRTYIYGGTLILGASTSIASSQHVLLYEEGSKLNISSGSKTIARLTSDNESDEVILGSSTLTIGTSQTSADGDGGCKGKFTGSGNVIKQGTGIFTLYGANGTTGSFTASAGWVLFLNKWAGNFIKNAGATLTLSGNATVGGTLTLNGGAGPVYTNTNYILTVTGTLSAAGNPNIVISPSAAPANQVLIQAASGINAANFTLTNTGQPSKLTNSADGKQLLLSSLTGIETVEQQVLKAWMQNGELHVSGLTPGQSWSVCNLSGQLVYQAVAKTEEANIPLAAQGVYVVTSGGNRVKLIAR